jgi:hypothetical protein
MGVWRDDEAIECLASQAQFFEDHAWEMFEYELMALDGQG